MEGALRCAIEIPPIQQTPTEGWDIASDARLVLLRQATPCSSMNTPSKAFSLLGITLAVTLGWASLLLLLAFLYRGSFQFFAFDFGPVAALGWDALLSLVFFLQHSVMVRRSFRQRLGNFVGEPFHGLVYAIASGAALLLCLILWQRAGEPVLRFTGAADGAFRAVFLLAIVGFGWGICALKSVDPFGVKPVMSLLKGKDDQHQPIVIRGPYRWVRHPLYFFSILLFWACPVITPDRLLFNVIWTTWVVFATRLEEHDLVSEFGDSYLQYQNEVPMILPWRIPARRSQEPAAKC